MSVKLMKGMKEECETSTSCFLDFSFRTDSTRSGAPLGEVGDVRLDDVGDLRHDVERYRRGRCHRGVVIQHRLTIKPLEDAKVDLSFQIRRD